MDASQPQSKKPHLVLLPTPGMGHLIPLAELAKVLVLRYGFTATFVTVDIYPKAQDFLDALPEGISTLPLPPVSLDDLGPDAKGETLIVHIAARSVPALRDALRALQETTSLAALITDLFGTDTFVVARELGVPAYVFFPPSATTLSLLMHLPELDKKIGCEYRDFPQLIRLPGCVPFHGSDLLDPVQDRKDQAYACVLDQARRYWTADGIFVNSFDDLETGAIKALQAAAPGKPPIYPVGPLTQSMSPVAGSASDPSGCIKWLDAQPSGSVLYVAFGSGGTLTSEQLRELALGLMLSGQRFLWVVQKPSDTSSSATFFTVDGDSDPLVFLPQGFVERTKEVGLVVPCWAPQAAVLGHRSTGGFLTHCGWNSTLEGIRSGVPFIAWPLYAEQKMNAVLLVEEVKVALRPRARSDGVVERGEVSSVVKKLMEGEEGKALRCRVQGLQASAARALAEGGSSYNALAEVADKWNRASAAGL